MARRLWLLVEWVEENNMFPSYGVVNIDSFLYRESDLTPGNEIFLSMKHNEPRRAKIIRIAENKQNVQEHKEFLERQDQQVKNVLQMCMRTIKEMKSEQFTQNGSQHNGSSSQINLPLIISANEDENLSDDDKHTIVTNYKRNKRSTNYINQSQLELQHVGSRKHVRQTYSPAPNQKHPPLVSSTPLPAIRPQEKTPLLFDQGTQTDKTLFQPPPLEKIEAIESVLLHLHERFQSLLNQTNISNLAINEVFNQNVISTVVENIQNSWVEESTIENEDNVTSRHVDSVEKMEVNNSNVENKNSKNMGGEKHNPINTSRVRRMSAQTTNSLEMVPIGDGNAMVPARLLNDIDWTSYTTATRQLLLSIFPRKVLATHSLTGKQSPAHQNKPPKKTLDPNLVGDIVKTVSSRCGVPKNLVRNCITVKCTDEAKLYRNRQKNRENRKYKSHLNNENVPPSQTPSSDELNLTV